MVKVGLSSVKTRVRVSIAAIGAKIQRLGLYPVHPIQNLVITEPILGDGQPMGIAPLGLTFCTNSSA